MPFNSVAGYRITPVLAVLVLTAAGCSASTSGNDTSASSPEAPTPALTWHACEPGSAGPNVELAAFRCATVTVPKDYREPDAGTIDLAVVQHPATDAANRVGTLFFNPGGPGGTGTVQLPQWFPFFPAEVRARFDIVSWDPRGVGSSTAVQCFATQDAEAELLGPLDPFPTDDAGVEAFDKVYAEIGQHCAERAGDLLPFVSTADTARDLDILRRAVGDEKISYWGVSYGSFLGATYVNMFPDKVRAVVLDGNIDPLAWTNGGESEATESISRRIGSDVATDAAVQEFLRACGEAGPQRCAFAAGSAEATADKWTTLLDRLKADPVVLGSRTVTYPMLVSQVDGAMDFVFTVNGLNGWSSTAESLQQLWEASNQPHGTAGADPAPRESGPPGSAAGRYTGPEQTWAIECGDSPAPPQDAWPTMVREAAGQAEDSARDLLWSDFVCADWKVAAKRPYTGPWDADTSAAILVVNNTHDNSTPFANAEAMVRRLKHAALLPVEGYGHTVLLNPSACANEHIATYLLDGRTMPQGTTCGQDAGPFGE